MYQCGVRWRSCYCIWGRSGNYVMRLRAETLFKRLLSWTYSHFYINWRPPWHRVKSFNCEPVKSFFFKATMKYFYSMTLEWTFWQNWISQTFMNNISFIEIFYNFVFYTDNLFSYIMYLKSFNHFINVFVAFSPLSRTLPITF